MTSEPTETSGQAVKRARIRHGWTQTELGKRAGVDSSVISRIEGGRKPGHPTTIIALAAALDIDVDYLIDRMPKRARRTDAKVAA